MRATQCNIEPVGEDVVALPEGVPHRADTVAPAPAPTDDLDGAA